MSHHIRQSSICGADRSKRRGRKREQRGGRLSVPCLSEPRYKAAWEGRSSGEQDDSAIKLSYSLAFLMFTSFCLQFSLCDSGDLLTSNSEALCSCVKHKQTVMSLCASLLCILSLWDAWWCKAKGLWRRWDLVCPHEVTESDVFNGRGCKLVVNDRRREIE